MRELAEFVSIWSGSEYASSCTVDMRTGAVSDIALCADLPDDHDDCLLEREFVRLADGQELAVEDTDEGYRVVREEAA
ncbi:hypothetical protein J2T57_001596 [Natronocella acetinitrilica]|uniref:Uncharacterized protein n=1 Tax=Natronocella acetinitrilica TaxID=414046 RepID=A0AAE3KB83_9GAMM|nr:hypothetical protein [Natronocella acetinitrilica]MCP1674494.1 hypothetical protein [Natronocella acetinitrilica]